MTTKTPTIPPQPSALTNLIASSTTPEPSHPLTASTLQILHNLQHQHLWTSLQTHEIELPAPSQQSQDTPSSSDPSSTASTTTTQYLISGIPPHHVYIHPDEQLYMLQRGLRETDIELERLFVLPAVQGQSWSLARLAAVFDSLPGGGERPAAAGTDTALDEGEGSEGDKAAKLAEYYEYREKASLTKEWGGKRILLAMADRMMGGDGTVVYYVVQEGAVKPRQN
ncbi:hypothetical protein P168DRAFT_310892 [Aspergillus campestris IBT 28561]|uniref:tRNA-splicing endonuclease subunit Sen15 domain-containing protein n=1 Tax=Aspergillus campestris (strain IBT 28561) TaxID=1392248 RepID=A0A2I1D314_ASPC2|nr:uncharacterized protein P168DRAFT_310892 [Aspergillus campestris IBT 28561]PKY04270.1 hypothetical protein P168DRAFT_310892 [Aspergillus campestris IBT 28561]